MGIPTNRQLDELTSLMMDQINFLNARMVIAMFVTQKAIEQGVLKELSSTERVQLSTILDGAEDLAKKGKRGHAISGLVDLLRPYAAAATAPSNDQ